MLYNWECCSFYPNNFGASALPQASVRVSTGQWKHVNRPVDDNWSLRKMALHLWLNLLVSFLSSLFIR